MDKRSVRKRKINHLNFKDFDFAGYSSSDDEDYTVDVNGADDDCNDDDDDDDDGDEDDDGSDDQDDSDGDRNDTKKSSPSIEIISNPGSFDSKTFQPHEKTVREVIAIADQNLTSIQKEKIAICAICLDDTSSDSNEIIECDLCKLTVHEDCYGTADEDDLEKSLTADEEAWFCDCCKCGVKNPVCQLCPNFGGALKETDCKQWVHVVCALYINDVKFNNLENFSDITLADLAYRKWSLKICSLCENISYSRTGICISCDAGLCRAYFHVTCAQRNGLLVENVDENDKPDVDPFYAHCKLHSDRALREKKRRNWLIYNSLLKAKRAQPIGDILMEKLMVARQRYRTDEAARTYAFNFAEKRGRLFTSSASFCRTLTAKGELMMARRSCDTNDSSTSTFDVRKRCAFSPGFVIHFNERNSRIKEMKDQIFEAVMTNKPLLRQQKSLRDTYDELSATCAQLDQQNSQMRQQIVRLFDNLKRMSTAAATYRFPPSLKTFDSKNSLGSTVQIYRTCANCEQRTNQHLIVTCDKCKSHYHVHCLDPPLHRLPKKSKLFGWQCSNCESLTSN